MEKVYNKWCEKLLDTGKGNRLINYKDIKMRTIDVLAPDSSELLKRISSGEKLFFYDVDSYIKVIREQAELTGEDEKQKVNEKLNKYKIQNTLSKFLTRKQLLAYKSDVTLHNLLRSVRKVAYDYNVEKGINILYITFGLLCWREKEGVEEWFNSPLVLIPISIDYNPQDKIYSLKEYEDDIVTNPTLLYKFKSEYSLDLPEFRQEGYENETLAEYLVRVQGYVETNNWFVKDEMKIGTFSFMKLDMYKDLVENKEKILKQTNIKKLLNKPEPELMEDVFGDENTENETTENNEIIEENIDESLEELEKKNEEINKEIQEQEKIYENLELKLHNVVDADSSQMNAIYKAKIGESFVLQGPPGSGKSQTITNLIAEFLNDGKKILFVSEKLAALNVVFNNLKKVGLSDFCLELHSNKTNKKEVINELYRILGQNKKSVNSSAKHEIEELEKYKEQLDCYTDVLHTVIPKIEKSPYEMFGIISENKDIPIFEYVLPIIDTRDSNYLNEAIDLLKLFIKYSEYVGYDYRVNTWAGFKHIDLTYQAKVELKNTFIEFLDYFDNLKNNVNIVNENLGFKIKNLEDLDKYLEFIRVVSNLEYFDNNIFNKNKLVDILTKINLYLKTKEKFEENKAKVLEKYTEEFLNLDIETLYQAYRDKYNKWYRFLISSYNKDKKILQAYQVKKFAKYKFDEVFETLKFAKETLALSDKLNSEAKEITNLLSSSENVIYDYEKVYDELLKLNEVLNFKFKTFDNIASEEFETIKEKLCETLEFYDENLEKRHKIEVLQNNFDSKKIKLYTMTFDEILDKFDACVNAFDKLENWNRFSGILEKLEKFDLIEFVDKSIDNNINRDTLHLTLKVMFYMQYVYFIIENNEILSNFSRFNQDMAVKNFKAKDKLNFEISKAKIISKVSSKMPDEYSIASGSQVSTLVREANKKIKQKPVRVLFKEIGELVQKLKPCLLMSPLSVSTYLEYGSCKFDVVIFDEASQIFPWDAIGAISRAKQVIVVGDSKQMPPSNFFNASTSSESDEHEEEYEDDALDFESILDLSSAVFNQHRLKWHYRSKTEELIEFSNANFYENSLVTFPSAYKNRNDMGVDFYFVEKGVFDRKSKTNKVEAERIVDLVFEHFITHPNRSLGVVAFSISQQEAIEELIQERREQFPEFEKFFDDSLVEPFFVKNLETVQGDERDTIIFSVAYAKDSTGKFIHNFGPLNKKGGERRLNVAVTRAKYNVKLVASIKSCDIDLSKSSAIGTKLLKEYLHLAEYGYQSSKTYIAEDEEIKVSIINEISDFLISKGYKIVKNIGYSEYKIDIGVMHPENSDFVLAIECDGETYKKAKTTRDRDRLRQEVLERLGWKFYRVWSVDWFLNKPIEKENLIKNIKKAIKAYDDNLAKDEKLECTKQLAQQAVVTETTAEKKENFIVETPAEKKDLKSFFDFYESYDLSAKKQATFHNSIFDIVKKEAPITEELLIKKTVSLFGREKITSHIRFRFKQEIARFGDVIFKIDDYYVVDKNMMVKMRIPKEGDEPRDIMHIANIELSSGMFVVIKNSVGITESGLFNVITNLLGFSRVGNNIQTKLKESLNVLLNNNLVKYSNGEYFINN